MFFLNYTFLNLEIFIIIIFVRFIFSKFIFENRKLFLTLYQKTSTDVDVQYLRRLSGAIFVKMNYVFLFGHKGLTVISHDFWITFTFDSSLGILLQSKSSFE